MDTCLHQERAAVRCPRSSKEVSMTIWTPVVTKSAITQGVESRGDCEQYHKTRTRLTKCVCLSVGPLGRYEAASNYRGAPNTKRFKRTLILTRTHSMHIFGEIPFIKTQNDTSTTDKRSKTMKNERKRLILFWLSFYSLSCAWKIVGMTMTCSRCDVMNIM